MSAVISMNRIATFGEKGHIFPFILDSLNTEWALTEIYNVPAEDQCVSDDLLCIIGALQHT